MTMKNFGSLMLAAVLGSVITMAATSWMGEKNDGIKIEHVSAVPISQVAYTTNEKGEMVSLDFIGTAEKVTKVVVHIRSTQQPVPADVASKKSPSSSDSSFSLSRVSKDQLKARGLV